MILDGQSKVYVLEECTNYGGKVRELWFFCFRHDVDAMSVYTTAKEAYRELSIKRNKAISLGRHVKYRVARYEFAGVAG